MIFNDTQNFNTAEEFVKFFQTHTFFQTKRIWEANTTGIGDHIYRGQADANWKLTPSVFRSDNSLDNFTPQPPGIYKPEIKLRWLGIHLHAELRSALIFLETADKLGIETPIDYSQIKDHCEVIHNALNEKEFDYSTPFPNDSALGGLTLAQHHGVPTRILDWTESPLIACFFASLNVSSIVPQNERVKSSHIAVICLSTPFLTKSEELVKIYAHRHKNNFLRSQQGISVLMPKANEYFLKNEKWPSVEDIVECNRELHGALKKYTLPTSQTDNLLKILFNHGITKYHLMPSLDNIAKTFSYASKIFKK